MVKKSIISSILLVIIGSTLIIGFPIPLISIELSTYATIHESLSYPIYNSNSSKIKTLNIYVEMGNIEVKYTPLTTLPIDYIVDIDVNLEMSGSILAGKSYEDFLNIGLVNNSSTLDFTLSIKSDNWFDSYFWLEQNISIIINIREDIVLDINTEIEKGDFKISVPWHVSLGKLLTKISKGNIFYNFIYCSISGNITGITNKGDLELKSYDVEYTQNSNWMLNCTGGWMLVEIHQYEEMGANVSGIATIINGGLDLFYIDNSAKIGALFDFPELWYGIPWDQPGFVLFIPPKGPGYSYTSNDFPTRNNYILSYILPDPRQSRSHELQSG